MGKNHFVRGSFEYLQYISGNLSNTSRKGSRNATAAGVKQTILISK